MNNYNSHTIKNLNLTSKSTIEHLGNIYMNFFQKGLHQNLPKKLDNIARIKKNFQEHSYQNFEAKRKNFGWWVGIDKCESGVSRIPLSPKGAFQ